MSRVLVLLCLVFSSAPVRAQECQEGGKLRLDSIRKVLTTEARRARLWRFGWIAAYGAATVGQMVPFHFLEDARSQVDWGVGAASSLVAMGVLVAFPLTVETDAAVVEGLPDTCEGMAEAQRLFERDAKNERDGRHWLVHLGDVALNAVFGLILGVGFGTWDTAAAQFGGGLLAGELTLFSQPNRLSDVSQPLSHLAVAPMVSPRGFGLRLLGAF